MTGQKIHLEIIYQVALLLIILGVTADNLLMVGISSNGAAIYCGHKRLLLGALLFVIQNTMLYWAKLFTSLTLPFFRYEEKWIALILLYFIAASSVSRWQSVNCERGIKFGYTGDNIILRAFTTAGYILALAMALYWLQGMDNLLRIFLQCFIAIFLAVGLLLGRKNQGQWPKIIHNICTVLLVIGIALLFFLTIK